MYNSGRRMLLVVYRRCNLSYILPVPSPMQNQTVQQILSIWSTSERSSERLGGESNAEHVRMTREKKLPADPHRFALRLEHLSDLAGRDFQKNGRVSG